MSKTKNEKNEKVEKAFTLPVPDPRLAAVSTVQKLKDLERTKANPAAYKLLADMMGGDPVEIVKSSLPEGFDGNIDVPVEHIIIDTIQEQCPMASSVKMDHQGMFRVLVSGESDGGEYLPAIKDLFASRLPGVDTDTDAILVARAALAREYKIILDATLPAAAMLSRYRNGFEWTELTGVNAGRTVTSTYGGSGERVSYTGYAIIDTDGTVLHDVPRAQRFADANDIPYYRKGTSNERHPELQAMASATVMIARACRLGWFGPGAKFVGYGSDGQIAKTW